MYVIMNKELDEVFSGYGPTGRPHWIKLEELTQEPVGFQLCIYKDPSLQIEELDRLGIKSMKMSIKGLFVLMVVIE